jgi:hypothetical protein
MAIFYKDGKSYTLEQPNPLVKTQEKWDPSELIFHNFEWDEVEIEFNSEKAKVPKIKPEEIVIKSDPKKYAPPKPKEKEPEPEVKDEKPEEEPREFDLPLLRYKVLSYCLPAQKERRTDALYGDTWEKVKYGKKFVFPSVVISSEDMIFEFWTSDPREQIKEGSIIYPYSYEVHNRSTDSYDKVPYDEYRWWKVSAKEKKEEGWLFTATPSEIQPDFSS